MSSPSSTAPAPQSVRPSQVDPRGPQLGAALTSVILALVLVTAPSPFATTLLAVQTVLFALGAGLGVQRTPYAWLFRNFVRPRLGPPAQTEDPAPPRFAQVVGLTFAVVGLLAMVSGLTAVALAAVGLALVAALLNAAFGLCLGCELYLTVKRLSPTPG